MKFFLKMRDFGLFDYLLKVLGELGRRKDVGCLAYTFFDYRNDESDDVWVCFLPWRVRFDAAKKLNLLPKKGRVIAFEGPVGMVHPDPDASKQALMRLVEDLKAMHLDSFNVLGLSVGTYPAFYVANTFNVHKFVCVAPGAKLGASLWDGLFTPCVRRQSQKTGISSAWVYDAVLKGTNPCENIAHLPASVELHIATHDKVIRTHHADDLLASFEKFNRSPRVHFHKGRGHVMTLIQYGLTHQY